MCRHRDPLASAAGFRGDRGGGGATITVAAPLAATHTAGAQFSGTGIRLDRSIDKPDAGGTQVTGCFPRAARGQHVLQEVSGPMAPAFASGRGARNQNEYFKPN